MIESKFKCLLGAMWFYFLWKFCVRGIRDIDSFNFLKSNWIKYQAFHALHFFLWEFSNIEWFWALLKLIISFNLNVEINFTSSFINPNNANRLNFYVLFSTFLCRFKFSLIACHIIFIVQRIHSFKIEL